MGATSFVIPDSVEKNVRFLAGKVDDVQLLFFESAWQARLPHEIDMNLLADLAAVHGLSYTVHLPLDLQLGSRDANLRSRCIDEICRIARICAPLSPLSYDLHLNQGQDQYWQEHCLQSLFELKERLGDVWNRLCVENIDYDFGLAAGIVEESRVKVCADFGHLHHQGFADDYYFREYDIAHVHLHGVSGGCDHQPLVENDSAFLKRLAQDMAAHKYDGVVTLELYKSEWLAQSLAILDRVWANFRLEGIENTDTLG